MSVLEERYASTEMKEIWSKEFKIKLEREFWIVVLKAQASAGLKIPVKAISDYERVLNSIDLKSISDREEVLHHDVKARIEEFNYLAGHELIHLGMTSRDLTENVEIFQIRNSLILTAKKTASLLSVISQFSVKYSQLPLVARTHNIPAQVTTLGRRFSTWGEELLFALEHLEELIERLPFRGLKGAVGTSSDLEELLPGKSVDIETEVNSIFNFNRVLASPSQIYPRSIDLEVVSTLNQIAATPSNIAINIRLMSGNNLVSEVFEENQTGSSAMPHKVNPRLSERINSLSATLKGFLVMINEISGNQWNEADVSCSAVRRVAISDSFFAIDGILDTVIHILLTLKVNEGPIKNEIDQNLSLLLSSTLLMRAVNKGIGREFAHKKIKEHSIRGNEDYLNGFGNSFLKRLLADNELNFDSSEINELVSSPLKLVGLAIKQVMDFEAEANLKLKIYPDAKTYKPPRII